ncbi:TIGR03086 family metal-binding protein [Modestobacter sp. VKM Ac-2984]|uniref:TIGR03086 family metal-binding protein n=1 Tax=Modestobacter sp. VKM Ac-2984 TaxID=3004138 RepID=UPI0022AB44A6|nr:TIGR03086 family metal-binding protein [Modestobacter sp. VKM Ac-2984]MCZ2816475.1 TIGR03086 family metal-binding protein [Modestobacter sp. VKM Ac-2984]
MPDPRRADLLMRFQRAQAQFTDRVDAVEPGEWDAPALPEWSVADLVAHLTGEQLWVPLLLAGESPGAIGPQVPTDPAELLGGDPLSAWEAAADAALTAWAADDALSRTVRLPAGPAPASDHLTEMTVDLTVHAWDLARAVGGDTALDPELVAEAFRHAEEHLGEDGVAGVFDAPVEVPPGADLQTRMLARFGRRV